MGGRKEGRTNVAYGTLGELHFTCGSGRTHDELRARIACARRKWTARTSLVTSTNTLQQSLVRRFPTDKNRQTKALHRAGKIMKFISIPCLTLATNLTKKTHNSPKIVPNLMRHDLPLRPPRRRHRRPTNNRIATTTRARLAQRRQPRDAHLRTRRTAGHEVPETGPVFTLLTTPL